MPPTDDDEVTENAPVADPYYQLVTENTHALVRMAAAIENHTTAANQRSVVIHEAKDALTRLATTEEAKLTASQGRWTDFKAAIGALWANTLFAGVLMLALSMLTLGLTLWVLAQLGIAVDQITPWLMGTGHTVPVEGSP